MKKVFLISMSLLACTLMACNDKPQEQVSTQDVAVTNDTLVANNSAVAIMTFTEDKHDFGTINEGDVVTHEFSFTNTGSAPLVITNAKGSCGCTVPEWPKEAIAPGASATLTATFNSKGKPNMQTKKITITANTLSGKETLEIKAMVTPKS